MAGRQTKSNSIMREAFMLDLFESDGDLTGAQANEKFKMKFGSKMNNNRVYQLMKISDRPERAVKIITEKEVPVSVDPTPDCEQQISCDSSPFVW